MSNQSTETLGLGRRKTAVARVRIQKGKGDFQVNYISIKDYFKTPELIGVAMAPLNLVELHDQISVRVLAHGGGLNGQASAAALGIARALQTMDPTLRVPLKQAGFLTRDSRMKERKKPGQPGARKRFQFSKR